jgi:hypothetical protein
MKGKTPETPRRIMPLPPGRKRHSPRMSRVTFAPDADGRLLALIRNATFISHWQLLELAMRAHIKATTSAIRQRIGRFLEYDLIQVVPARTVHTGAVYQITRWGLSALESFGLGIHSISSETERLPSVLQAPHFLDLNAVRIAFLRTQLLSRCEWITDPEIKTHNTTPLVRPFAKDYDAVVKLTDCNGQAFQIGVEYERTYKTIQRYEEIAETIETEKELSCVLYIASSSSMAMRLVDLIRCPTFPICVTATGILCHQTLNATVGFLAGRTLRTSTLRQYFATLKHPI